MLRNNLLFLTYMYTKMSEEIGNLVFKIIFMQIQIQNKYNILKF